MNGQQCYCVNKFGQPSDSCTVTCASGSSYYCGSYEAMSVYATGQQGMICSNTNLFTLFHTSQMTPVTLQQHCNISTVLQCNIINVAVMLLKASMQYGI